MIDIMAKKNYFFAVPIIILIVALVIFLAKGIIVDIQFQGGTIIEMEMQDSNFDPNEIGAVLNKNLNRVISAQKVETYNPEEESDKLSILMLKIPEENLSDEEINSIIELMTKEYNAKRVYRMQNVEPFIANETKQKGIRAVTIASALILVYIWWRFSTISGLPAGVAALIALIHDTLMILAAYIIFRIPINESFVAAVLTILGYSINDTIIIYDRIRENSKRMGGMSLRELSNISIKQTLSRTINTSLTTLIAILTVYIFASLNNIESIKDFTFPLIIGTISGVYSTLFIAIPLWVMWKEREARRKIEAKPTKARG